jgi:DUF4097 and DUF4098 domain-containing protein YvlB
MTRSLLLLAALLAATPLPLAQSHRTLTDDAWCKDDDNRYTSRYEKACEVREFVLPATALDLDPSQNGGVSVKQWERPDVLVRVRVSSAAATEAEARRLVSASRVSTANGRVRADLPDTDRDDWASVSYEVFAPAQTDLAVRTHNGGVSVQGIRGEVRVEAMNGGISLRDVGGSVQARTTNGGISIALDGGAWAGKGLDAETTNGGISITLPRAYSAEIEARTQMGRISAPDLTVRGATRPSDRRFGDEIRGTLGEGGPRVRAVTRNGGISITQEG